MNRQEKLDKIRQDYAEDKLIAKHMWGIMDSEGNEYDYSLFEMGFICGINYSRRLESLQKLSELDQKLGLQ